MNKITIISNPIPTSNQSGKVSLAKLIRLAEAITDDVTVLAGNIDEIEYSEKTSIVSIPREKKTSKIINYICYLYFQCKCFVSALRVISKDSKVLFWIADSMPLCMLAARIRHAETYYFIYGNINKIDRGKVRVVTSIAIRIMTTMATYVCAEDCAVFNEWGQAFEKKEKRIIHLYSDYYSDRYLPENNRKTVGMECRVSRGKHVCDVIKAFNMFHLKYPEWKLEIIGNGDQYDECVELINRNEANQYIKMLGWISHEQLPELLSNWSFAVAPSDSEGLPNSVIECMSCGVPCLASPVGGVANLIKDGINGWILDTTDAETIYHAMLSIAEMKSHIEIGIEAQRTIQRKYSFTVAQENLLRQL